MMQQCALQLNFIGHVFFTDEATFSLEDVFYSHIFYAWATNNPHATRPYSNQQRFCVNVWGGIANDFLIGPYCSLIRLNGKSYLIFLKQALTELLQDVLTDIRDHMWFQNDGARAHFSADVPTYLNVIF